MPIQSRFIDVKSTYYLNFWRTGTKVFYMYIGMIQNYTTESDNILVQNINLPAAFVPGSYNSARGSCNLYANNKPNAMGNYLLDLKTSGGKLHIYTSQTGSVAQIDIMGVYYIL